MNLLRNLSKGEAKSLPAQQATWEPVMYVCGVPQDAEQFAKVASTEESLFGDLALSREAANEFFRLRPELFSAVFSPEGTVAAYMSAYPLRAECAEALIAGDIGEPDLTPGMLLEREDDHEHSRMYLGSVVVASKYRAPLKSILLGSMFLHRIHQLREAEIRRFTLIMGTATRQGRRLAERTGARKLQDGANRSDGLDVYSRDVTPGLMHYTATVMEGVIGNTLVRMDYTSHLN